MDNDKKLKNWEDRIILICKEAFEMIILNKILTLFVGHGREGDVT